MYGVRVSLCVCVCVVCVCVCTRVCGVWCVSMYVLMYVWYACVSVYVHIHVCVMYGVCVYMCVVYVLCVCLILCNTCMCMHEETRG